jgi:hypothetical protein
MQNKNGHITTNLVMKDMFKLMSPSHKIKLSTTPLEKFVSLVPNEINSNNLKRRVKKICA